MRRSDGCGLRAPWLDRYRFSQASTIPSAITPATTATPIAHALTRMSPTVSRRASLRAITRSRWLFSLSDSLTPDLPADVRLGSTHTPDHAGPPAQPVNPELTARTAAHPSNSRRSA